MDTPTSFIPKQVLSRETRRPEAVGFFTVIALVVLIVSALFLGGVYFYHFILTDEINRPCPSDNPSGDDKECGLRASLARSEDRLKDEQTLIQHIERLSNKIKRAKSLLAGHISVLPVFRLLEELTLETVGYSNFGYDGEKLTLSGRARSYESIALQSAVFAENPNLVKSFVFSGLGAVDDGSVNFQLTLVIDPGLALYAKTTTL